ncbi:uncharacterized protein YlzI (FlbEa/FlbD family) [Pedobacter sp. CG_S7]|uniref:hypothetical protein n=1 Tax=Pedobacter sp. CG_S7 TaxID=3143930 RepID=UPI0033965358
MHLLLHFPLTKPSLLALNQNCPDEIIKKIPLFALTELLLHHIFAVGKIKLTPKGNLPIAICEMLYQSKELNFTYKILIKKITEDDVPYIWVIKDYLLVERLIKKRNNVLTITQNGEKYLLKNKIDCLSQLILFFTRRINWINFHHNGEDVTGKLGWAYSLYLLKKYGAETRDSEFYFNKIMDAFGSEDPGITLDFKRAYDLRFFNYFCNWFGFAIDEQKDTRSSLYINPKIRKTELLDQLFV